MFTGCISSRRPWNASARGTASAALHTWLRLRSTHPGGSNRLDFVKLVSVDELETVPRPDIGEWKEIDDPEMAYRR